MPTKKTPKKKSVKKATKDNPKPQTSDHNFAKFLTTITIALSIAALVIIAVLINQNNHSDTAILQTEEALIENTEPQIPDLSTSEIKVIQADEISAKDDLDNDSQVKTTRTYSNPFFPGFQLDYPEDWTFETSTSESQLYDGLLERELKLSKNGSELIIDLIPVFGTGCGGGDPTFVPPTPSYLVPNNELKEFENFKGNTIYQKDFVCAIGQVIPTNIPATDIPSYTQLLPEETIVRYFYNITTNVGHSDIDTNPEIPEIREILNTPAFQ